MTNFEKYKDKILEIKHPQSIAVDKFTNEPVNCKTLDCEECLFYDCGGCNKNNLLSWLYEEYKEPSKIAIPKDTPIDAKILVSNDNIEWHRRYLAGFSNDGRVRAFSSGATSWSNENQCNYNWTYAKLAKD